jgi:alpha-2-macroglobulin-like protein
MKSPKLLSLLLPLLLLGLLSVDVPHTGSPFFELLKALLQRYNQQLPDEKVYLQLDKPFYKPGDDIWFQAYVVAGTTHKASPTSSVLYVELLNPQGNVESKLSLPVEGGGARGDFRLEASAAGGLYKIRAYTQWMQNFEEETFYSRELQVQKVIKPRLLLKLDFEKEAYGPSDEVVATLKARDLENRPISSQEVTYTVQLAGRQLHAGNAQTDAQGEARVQFALPADLNSSDGLLNILITNRGIQESISRAVPIVLHRIDLQFFPEGGELVSGMRSKVAFKALNEFGKPADVEGEILNQQGQVVERFKSFHMGMGAFSFTPQTGEQYQARITRPLALAKPYALPDALPNGWGLAIDQKSKESLSLTIYSPLAKPLLLVGQLRGEIYYTKEIAAQKGYTYLEVPLADFPMGVAQFTLFDHQQLERCERLVFVNQHRKLHIELAADKEAYQPREKVSLKVRTFDEHQLPVPAKISLSVVDDKLISFADDKQDNILSYLLLSSDVKGKIEEPAFYFDPEEPKATEALDYLLMTQAWRRFRWQQLQEGRHTVAHYPEKLGTISGRIVDVKSGKPREVTVTLVELSSRRRAAQLKTRPDGSFLFMNVDPAAAIQLFAKSQGNRKDDLRIVLDQQISPYYRELAEAGSIPPPPPIFEAMMIEVADEEYLEEDLAFAMSAPLADAVAVPTSASMSQDIILREDVQQLSEVVVVGYGTAEHRSLTGAVVHIRAEEMLGTTQTLEQSLQGKAAGVQISQNTGSLNENARVMIRGSSSIANGNPLFVVDGFPVESRGSSGLSALGFLSPDDIRSVTVLKSPEAAALYGSRGSNGVILINTKSGRYQPDYNRQYQDNYAGLYIEPRKFSAVREYYAPAYTSREPVEVRTDFRESLYWNPSVQTDRKGEARLSFYTSDATTAFRITAEGMGANGYAGRQELVISSQLPMSLEAKIPAYLSFEDQVSLPIQLTNNTDEVLKGRLSIEAVAALQSLGTTNPLIEIPPRSTTTYYYEARVLNQAGTFALNMRFEGGSYLEQVSQEIDVLPKGFPIEVSFSGQELQKAFSFSIQEPVPGSVRASFTAYPNVVSDLMAGIESVLRQPHGCFEQVSSSTYPNVLALQFLRETRQASPEIEAKAQQFIQEGYRKLAAYETRLGGFEWYGNTPPHEGLTAFGLLEFTEMKKVYPGVSEAMLRRTKQFLLDRRSGDGNFKQNAGKWGFAGAEKAITNAYIVYALSAEGVSKEIEKEYSLAFQEALKSRDTYRMALMANAAYSLKKEEDGKRLLQLLLKEISEKGLGQLTADHSLVRSYGKSLQLETASLIALALLKEERPSLPPLQQIIQYLVSNRSHGGFGSTQGTILALTAITEWAKFANQTQEGGLISLKLNGSELASTRYARAHKSDILMASLENKISSGRQQLKILFEETSQALPYSFNASWTSYTPASSKACRVSLKTALSAKEVKVNETVRLTATLSNKTAEGIPQTVALIGIPSGLSLQPWQLKEYQEKGLFDFYEIQGNMVIFYYREMAPNDQRTIQLDLKADIPGTYQASASSAYLYYTNEHKDWVAGEQIRILK